MSDNHKRVQAHNSPIPRGIEVLLKKAAVDPEFRQRLLQQRGGVAATIGLNLQPSEEAMLRTIPEIQLDQIIAGTVVPMEQRRVFLGKVAAAMLAVVGVGLTGCQPAVESAGVRPDRPTNQPPATSSAPQSRGISPDRP